MGRPPKDIKYKRDHASRRLMVGFAESPGAYHMTPETDLPKALAWARRNRGRLLAKPDTRLLVKTLAPGFFDLEGRWYQDRRKKRGSDMTAASLAIRQAHIPNYILPLFGEFDIRALTGEIINRTILDAPRASTRGGKPSAKPLSRGTRSKLLYSLKLMYDQWVGDGLVRENPTASIVKYSKDPEAPRSALPREVMDKLFPASHGELVRVWGSSMWACLMLMLMDTGARPGEIRALRWRDYYPDERFVPLRRAVQSGTRDTIKTTKNDRAKPGYIRDRTAQELAIWRAESRHSGDDDWIFTAKGDAPLTPEAVGQAFARTLSGLGYDATGWTPYWLRHSFVTYSLEVLSEEEVTTLAGHSVQVSRGYQHQDDVGLLRGSRALRDKLDRGGE